MLSSLNAVISTNESTQIITGHVFYNPAYTYKFQLKTTLGEFNISINGEKQIVTKRRAKVTSNQLQVYVSVPMDSEQSGGPITQPLLAKHENGCAGNGQKTAIIITQEC